MRTYVTKLLSGWGQYTTVDHAPGSQRVNNEKKPGLPHHRKPGAWLHNRMFTNEFHRLKLGGTNAAQTPSSASAPDQIGTLAGADTLSLTATNQSPSQTAGGGRYGTV